jgi:hypothetical protein
VTSQDKVHETSISVDQLAVSELDGGAEIQLRVKVSCSDFCDLRGSTVNIIAPDESVTEVLLTGFNGAENVAGDFVVTAPKEQGTYTWTAVFPEQENAGILHLESSAPRSFDFKPHGISIAVWDVPFPALLGAKFKAKVGVRCSADCKLTGKAVEIFDGEGGKVATERLGDVSWPGTDALYWAEVELEAPGTEGYFQWTVKFPRPELEAAHEPASYVLGFATAKPPEHLVTVSVIDKDSGTPMGNVEVNLHPYTGRTDELGVATVGVPKGHYDVYVSAPGKKIFRMPVEVAGDAAVTAELVSVLPDLEMM